MTLEGPLVLTADFNTVSGEGLLKQHETAGLQTMQKGTVTWKRMPYVLDHIFYYNHLLLKGGSVDEVTSSDHHVLVADFKI